MTVILLYILTIQVRVGKRRLLGNTRTQNWKELLIVVWEHSEDPFGIRDPLH